MKSEALFDGKHIGLGTKSRPFASQETAVRKAKDNHLRVVLSKKQLHTFYYI